MLATIPRQKYIPLDFLEIGMAAVLLLAETQSATTDRPVFCRLQMRKPRSGGHSQFDRSGGPNGRMTSTVPHLAC